MCPAKRWLSSRFPEVLDKTETLFSCEHSGRAGGRTRSPPDNWCTPGSLRRQGKWWDTCLHDMLCAMFKAEYHFFRWSLLLNKGCSQNSRQVALSFWPSGYLEDRSHCTLTWEAISRKIHTCYSTLINAAIMSHFWDTKCPNSLRYLFGFSVPEDFVLIKCEFFTFDWLFNLPHILNLYPSVREPQPVHDVIHWRGITILIKWHMVTKWCGEVYLFHVVHKLHISKYGIAGSQKGHIKNNQGEHISAWYSILKLNTTLKKYKDNSILAIILYTECKELVPLAWYRYSLLLLMAGKSFLHLLSDNSYFYMMIYSNC